MEKDGLDELYELERKREEQIFNQTLDNDDAMSNMDIREFERRLKSSRSTRGNNNNMSAAQSNKSNKNNDSWYEDDDDDDDNFDGPELSSLHNRSYASSTSVISQAKSNIQAKLQQIKAKEKKLTHNHSLSSGQSPGVSAQSSSTTVTKKNLKKYDDPQLESIMKATNVEQKIKDLLQNYGQLLKSFEREKQLRLKYEGEHLTTNKTRLEETVSMTTKYQKTKGLSVLAAINTNEENVTLKQELQRLGQEIQKKDKMIAELVSSKPMGSTMNSIGSSSNGFKFLEDSKAKRIEQEMKTLKKERDEFFAARFDKKNFEMVKDLSYQNSKMRVRLEELEAALKTK